VCDITDALSLPQSTVSRHLNTLKHYGLVVAERKGKWVYYDMSNCTDVNVISELIKGASLSDEQLQQDLARLEPVSMTPISRYASSINGELAHFLEQ